TGAYFSYLVLIQRCHYRTLDGALGSADEIGPAQTPATFDLKTNGNGGARKPLTIKGPESFAVGHPSQPFSASTTDKTKLDQIDWSIAPSNSALIRRTKDGRARIIAA